MLERYLVEHCSPTLASIKTANLFTFTYHSSEEVTQYIDCLLYTSIFLENVSLHKF